MKIEDQVVSLELAKRMKELGFPQESLFYWATARGYGAKVVSGEYGTPPRHYRGKVNPTSFSAYTVAELGEMLPEEYITWRSCPKDYRVHTLAVETRSKKFLIPLQAEATEANARAKMLIYLKENNLL